MASGALVDRPSFAHRAGDRLRRGHRRRHGLGEGVRTVSAEALQPESTSPAMRTAPALFTPAGLRARVIKIVSPHASIAPAWSRSIAAAIVISLSLISAGVGGRDVVDAAALALPLVPSRILTTTLDRVAPNALPPRSLDRLTGRAPRPTRGQASPSTRRPNAEPPAASLPPRPPRAEPVAPPATEVANQVDAVSAAEADARPAAGEPSQLKGPVHPRDLRSGRNRLNRPGPPSRPEARPWAGNPKTPVSRPPVSSPVRPPRRRLILGDSHAHSPRQSERRVVWYGRHHAPVAVRARGGYAGAARHTAPGR